VDLLVSEELNATTEDSRRSVVQLSPGTVEPSVIRPKVTPIALERAAGGRALREHSGNAGRGARATRAVMLRATNAFARSRRVRVGRTSMVGARFHRHYWRAHC